MRSLFSFITAISVVVSSLPLFAQDILTLQTKDLGGKELNFQIRNHSVLQFKRESESGWTNVDMSRFEQLGRRVFEIFKVNDRVFYIFTEPGSTSPNTQHVGEIVYRPIPYKLNGRFVGWSGYAILSVGGVLLGLANPGSELASVGVGVFMAGVCIIAGGFWAPVSSRGDLATVESNQPICVSPDGNVKYERAVLKHVHRNELGQIVDVDLAVEVGAAWPRITSLAELTRPQGCEGAMTTPSRNAGIDP